MSVFSTNQARQLYVANTKNAVTSASTAGTIEVCADTNKTHLYFKYMGAGGQTRSDLIDVKNIISAKVTDAKDLARELKTVTVALDSNFLESNNPIVGQDYILRIAIRQFVGMSDEDFYFKYGAVHVFKGMTASDFYVKMAESLVKNFSRELTKYFSFYLYNGSTKTEITTATDFSTLSDTYAALIIAEAEQEWTLGIKPQVPVYFEVQPTTITYSGDEVIWGVVESADPAGVVTNGKQIADLEYFCMGERGDIYRNINWPNSIPTKYLVDPTKQYNVIDIHYYWTGSNENVQKSEKTLTIVVPKVGDSDSVSNVLANSIVSDINTKIGTTIKPLSVA